MEKLRPASTLLFVAIVLQHYVFAQHPPAIGYMYPPGGQVGHSTEVILGGYDWTPDMQVFVHDERIHLEILEAPGEIIVPAPPFWFGKKSRRPPFLLPRETRARLTIPGDVEPGIVKWQVANANGASAAGRLMVSSDGSIREEGSGDELQQVSSLPVRISGQIKRIQEVDRYRFSVDQTGPVTCMIDAKTVGSPLNAVLEIRDVAGRVLVDAADTSGNDTAVTFFATRETDYVAAIYDLDFRGNRSFTYQLSIFPGPRVIAAIPSTGCRGQVRNVQFIGYGLATGQNKLESITQQITFPSTDGMSPFRYMLNTDHGDCVPFQLHLSERPQFTEAESTLSLPCGVTGVLEEAFREDRYAISGKKGDVWAIDVATEHIGSAVDAAVAVYNNDGEKLVRNDDRPGSVDAALEFKVPTDGEYQIGVSDVGSTSGTKAATYHLSVRNAEPDFRLSVPELLNAPLDGKVKLSVKVERKGSFLHPIDVALVGLPDGVTAPDSLQVDAKQKALNIELTVAADAPANGRLVSVKGSATINGIIVEHSAGPMLVATTIKPPFTIDAEGKDDVTKWPRGTTFPAPVLISRDEGFVGDIVLEMTSKQGRHRQGIFGPELTVKPGVDRVLYPVFLPEWLETTRTSRMVVNGVAQVEDPQGNFRYSVSRQKTRMGFLPTGALLKVSADQDEFRAKRGESISVPISISRAAELPEPIVLQLAMDTCDAEHFTATHQSLNANNAAANFVITVAENSEFIGEKDLTIRATLLRSGHLPVISETKVLVEVVE